MTETTTTLNPTQAVYLWRQGREVWNRWVQNNPEADIDFTEVDFIPYQSTSASFADFHFPNGDVAFDRARFGDGKVSFEETQFGNGGVSFGETQFGNGEVSFGEARFGDGKVSFEETQFGNGGVSFGETQFGNGEVSFLEAQFGKGEVSFDSAQFGNGDVSFGEARFGDGKVSFEETQFGNGGVSFGETHFGNGEVSFLEAQFGKGEVSFDSAQFGNGDVSFHSTKFGDGDVSFEKAEFGKGDVSFVRAQFGNDSVSFENTQFGNGGVSFNDARFGNGDVLFVGAKFGDGDVSFHSTKFGDGDVWFNGARFGNGDVLFLGARFGDGDVSFEEVQFGNGEVMFDGAHFGGRALFTSFKEMQNIKKFSLKYATFEGGLILEVTAPFCCIPDLRGVKSGHQIILDNVKIVPQREDSRPCGKFTDPEDAARLRRLKEIAEQNKDHVAALEYKALESQATRHQPHQLTSWWGLFAERVFHVLSNYGRSELRPLLALGLLWWLYAGLYSALSVKLSFWASLLDSLGFSAAQMLLFVPSALHARGKLGQVLFGSGDWPNGLYALTFSQSLLGGICILLIGLALRNRFRL